jgi:hypothetical protein
VKLFLACFWFLVGISILAVRAFTDQLDQSINLFGGKFSLSWLAGLAIFLGLFNMVRWGLERAARLQNRQADAVWAEQMRRRIRETRPERSAEDVEPNPDFDFNKPPNGA